MQRCTEIHMRTKCTSPRLPVRRPQMARRNATSHTQIVEKELHHRLYKRDTFRFVFRSDTRLLADETHHRGATYRLLSVPKAHTFARPLCRKTSLLSGGWGVRWECCSFSECWMNQWLVRSAQRSVRGGAGRARPLLRKMCRAVLKVWRVVSATGQQQGDKYDQLTPRKRRWLNI